MQFYKSFSCFVLGETSLALHCAETLIKSGHTLRGIITRNPKFQDWALASKITCFNSISQLDTVIEPFEYIFNIVNYDILPPNILKKPKRFAINFHDGLLPAYAGMHATSWAIINGETEHGITWHLIREGIDTGEILKQVVIPITLEETALSLNLKCYTAAQKSFIELIDELATESYAYTPQDLSKRTYYPRYLKPANNGVIDWHSPAYQIDRLVRALEFGSNQPNTLASAKIVIEEEVYIVKQLRVLENTSRALPGEIISVKNNGLVIATSTTDILITQLSDCNGKTCELLTIYNKHFKRSESNIPIKLNPTIKTEIEKIPHSNNETYWISQLNSISPYHFPFLQSNYYALQNKSKKKLIEEVTINQENLQSMLMIDKKKNSQDINLALLCIYLHRLTHQSKTSFRFTNLKLLELDRNLKVLLSDYVPYNFEIKRDLCFKEFLDRNSNLRAEIESNGTFLKDVFARYPDCHHDINTLPITVILTNELPNSINDITSPIVFLITNDYKIRIYLNSDLAHSELHNFLSYIPKRLDTLLNEIIKNPKQSIADASITPEAEKLKMLKTWNNTKRNYPKNKMIHQLFEAQVASAEERTALVFGNEKITYGQLNAKANRIAHYIKKLITNKNCCIAIYINANPKLIISMLAILKAGYAYMPIDPTKHSMQRMIHMLEMNETTILLTETESYSELSNNFLQARQVINIDNDGLFNTMALTNLEIGYSSTDLAYIIHTSGTTNQPKRVMIEHRSVVNFLYAMKEILSADETDRFLFLTSIGFDIAVLEIYLPLICGACCIIADKNTNKDGHLLRKLLSETDVSIMQATPTTWQLLLETGWRNTKKMKMLCGGEALPSTLAQRLFESGSLLWNMYGPTETTVWSTCHQVQASDFQYPIVPIGNAISNTTLYVLDQNQEVSPIGHSGELHIGGEGLARGYLDQPELTKQKFIKNRFMETPNSYIYKTGDLVRWLSNGELEYLGRMDDQIKIRGFRIEPSEIEEALLKNPDIAQAVVLLQQHLGHPQLVAFIVTKKNLANSQSLNATNIQKYLSGLLPTYMIPSRYVKLDELPLNSNGKISKKVLLDSNYAELPSTTIYQAPTTKEEVELTSIWETLLKTSPISIKDNFFSLGGDSIIVMQIIKRLETETGFTFSVEDIFESPTIEFLSKKIKAIKSRKKLSEFKYSKNNYELSPLQQGMLFQRWQTPNSGTYEIQLHWTINQLLNLKIFRNSWVKLSKRHAVLRTSLNWLNLDQPLQILHENISLPWHFHDWRHIQREQQEIKFKDFLDLDQKNLIDLNHAPLFRIHVIQFSDHCYKVVWHLHHILLDGWSISLLLSEIANIYESSIKNQKIRLLPTYPYEEYVYWLSTQDWSPAEKFWMHYLKGYVASNHLEGFTNSKIKNKTVSSHQSSKISLELEHSQDIYHFIKNYNITLSTLFQGVWGILLHKYTESNDILFGVTNSGRNLPLSGIDERIGLFINTLPLRIDFSKNLTIIDYLKDIQTDFARTNRYSYTPLAYVKKWSKLQLTDHSLFDSIVVIENYPNSAENKKNIISFENLSFWDPTDYGLTFIIIPKATIELKLNYDGTEISDEMSIQILNHCRHLIYSIITKPNESIESLSILTDGELQELSNNSENHPLPQRTIIQSFEDQAKIFPNRLAIVFGNDSLDYQQLNHKANQLAHYLNTLNLDSETAIACCLPRSIDWIVALLAIWKAGLTYVPIDPQSPLERLNILISIGKITTIITNNDILENVFSKSPDLLKNNFIFIEHNIKISNHSNINPSKKSNPNNLAYILFTSGTTGYPKAVAQEHKTLANLVSWQTKTSLHSDRIIKVSQFASLSFDVSLQEICYALSNGLELHIVSSEVKESLSLFLNFIETNKIQQIFLPTAFLLSFCEAANFEKPNFNHLTDIFVSGEKLKICDAIKSFFSNYKSVSLTNQYGPTETHVVSAFQLPKDTAKWPTFPPIGKPIDHTEFYILNKNKKIVPFGINGELYIGGINLARYYFNDPDKTQQSFFHIQVDNVSKKYLYKSGDIVRQQRGGLIEYIGRIDKQIKIRGYRIEPAEVETALMQLFDIKAAAVKAVSDQTDTLTLVGYLVARNNKNIEITSTLKKSLETLLPSYMIPSHYVWLDKLPLTTNGKIDYQLLPSPKWQQSNIQVSSPPKNYYEEKLIELWTKILGISICTTEADFFSLGGHSLSTLKLLLAIEKEFQLKFTVNDFFSASTVEKLAKKIQQYQAQQVLLDFKKINYNNQNFPFPIVCLQPHGNKNPLFIIHPVGGTIFWFMDLAKHLGTDRPIYGIQDPAVISQQIVFDTIEEMAHFYLYCIRQIQKKGPYIIAGASFGATVAFEIAKTLEQSGQPAQFVGLLDGWSSYPKALKVKSKFQKLMHNLGDKLYSQFQINELEHPEHWLDLQWHRNGLLWKYSLVRINTKLSLFKAEQLLPELAWANHPFNYWDDYSINPIDVHLIPGDHETMFKEPNVRDLAAQLNDCIKNFS